MDRPRILRLLRIAFSAMCGIACLLLIVLWVRSYWSVDIFKGRLSSATGVQCASMNGRLLLVTFPSRGSLGWLWDSVTDTTVEQHPSFTQLRSEYQAMLTSLECELTTSFRGQRATVVAAQINQCKVEFEIMRARMKELVVSQMWADSIQSGLLMGSLRMGNFTQDVLSVENHWGFGFKRLPNGLAIASPHWFSVLISGVIAVALGFRRSWRFSLRALLIGTTLVAVLLGTIVYSIR